MIYLLSLHKIIAIVLGSVLISVGINYFLMPFKVLDGGIIGIALIINYLFGIKVGLVMFLCSLPIFLVAWIYYRDIFYNSIFGLIISSSCIDLLEPSRLIRLSPFSSSVIGGFVVGTGIGIMLRYETSTGGTDLLAQLVTKLASLNVGVIIFLIDAFIVSLGGFLISADTFFLSIITITAGGVATSLCTIK